ncbi:hypothetical protein IGS74_18850 [Aureimonas sp. OT7]|uniref:hypothetical protein n=1 Tax=Aureimonas sp. OT7 TaxID=2816454 RepID=UPI0017875D1B|nr:hypothetical protein [Aureimonas sp. OT7]QOG06541.1 hypothetical protein IGS74_18850 [Aureimonas sp. OT7]
MTITSDQKFATAHNLLRPLRGALSVEQLTSYLAAIRQERTASEERCRVIAQRIVSLGVSEEVVAELMAASEAVGVNDAMCTLHAAALTLQAMPNSGGGQRTAGGACADISRG